MPTQQFSNYVSTTLNGSITSGAVSLVVSSAAGFPTSGNFQIVIDNNEICQVTAVAGTTYTVTRAYEAINGVQVASAHSNGAPVVIVLTVQGLSLGFARLDQGNTFVGAETFNNDVTFGARAVFSTAISKIVPGATSISFRNNADNADNVIIADAGSVTLRTSLIFAAAASQIVPGATSIAIRNNANGANNLILTDVGAATLRNAISLPPSAAGTVAPTSYGTLPVKIAEATPSAANIDFNSIPAGFRHLVLEYSLRSARAGTPTDDVLLTLNGDTGNNYGWQRLSSIGATTASTESGAAAAGWMRDFFIPAATAPANMMGTGRIFIPNYTGSQLKFARMDYTSWLTAAAFPTAGQMEAGVTHNFWNSTAAITRIQMTGSGGNFASGVATLYGIP